MVQKIKYISNDMDNEILRMQKNIEEVFGIKISRVNASKIVAYKSKHYNIQLTAKTLLEIIGGNF